MLLLFFRGKAQHVFQPNQCLYVEANAYPPINSKRALKDISQMKVALSIPYITLFSRWTESLLCTDQVHWGIFSVMVLLLIRHLTGSREDTYSIERLLQNTESTVVPFEISYSNNRSQTLYHDLNDQLMTSQSELLNAIDTLLKASSIVTSNIRENLNNTMKSLEKVIYDNLQSQSTNLEELERLIETSAAFVSSDVESKISESIPLNYTWIHDYLDNAVEESLNQWSSIKRLKDWSDLKNSNISADIDKLFQNSSALLYKMFQDESTVSNQLFNFNATIFYNNYKYSDRKPNQTYAKGHSYDIKTLVIWNMAIPIVSIPSSLLVDWINRSMKREAMQDVLKSTDVDQIKRHIFAYYYNWDTIMLCRLVNYTRYRKSIQTFHKELKGCYVYVSILFGNRSSFMHLGKSWTAILVFYLSVVKLLSSIDSSNAQKQSMYQDGQIVSLPNLTASYSANDTIDIPTNIIASINGQLHNGIKVLLEKNGLEEVIEFNNSQIISIGNERNATSTTFLVSTSDTNFTIGLEIELETSLNSPLVIAKQWTHTYLLKLVIALSTAVGVMVVLAFITTVLSPTEGPGSPLRPYTASNIDYLGGDL